VHVSSGKIWPFSENSSLPLVTQAGYGPGKLYISASIELSWRREWLQAGVPNRGYSYPQGVRDWISRGTKILGSQSSFYMSYRAIYISIFWGVLRMLWPDKGVRTAKKVGNPWLQETNKASFCQPLRHCGSGDEYVVWFISVTRFCLSCVVERHVLKMTFHHNVKKDLFHIPTNTRIFRYFGWPEGPETDIVAWSDSLSHLIYRAFLLYILTFCYCAAGGTRSIFNVT